MLTRDAGERLRSLDVLRGIAIIGTLLSNIGLFTSLGGGSDSPEPDEPATFAEDGWSHLSEFLSEFLSGTVANGKFLGLLSILFGVGMAIQFDSARRKGIRWPWRYEWRSLLLLADGFLHFALVVEFDILMGYALTAMVVAPLLLLRTRWLVVAAIIAGLVHLALEAGRVLSSSAPAREDASMGDGWKEFSATDPGATTYFSEVAARLEGFWGLREEAFVIAPPLSAFLFLAGALLWRAGLFAGDRAARKLSRRLAVAGLGVGVPLTLWGDYATRFGDEGLPGMEILESLSRYTIAPIVAFGYLGLVLILLRHRGGTGFFARRLADVGRTALSCYMTQNVIGLVAFSSWGLGLGPVGSLGTIVAWAAISALLMIAACLWLRRFRQGPFELVWRAGVDAPFRRADRRRREQEATADTTQS